MSNDSIMRNSPTIPDLKYERLQPINNSCNGYAIVRGAAGGAGGSGSYGMGGMAHIFFPKEKQDTKKSDYGLENLSVKKILLYSFLGLTAKVVNERSKEKEKNAREIGSEVRRDVGQVGGQAGGEPA